MLRTLFMLYVQATCQIAHVTSLKQAAWAVKGQQSVSSSQDFPDVEHRPSPDSMRCHISHVDRLPEPQGRASGIVPLSDMSFVVISSSFGMPAAHPALHVPAALA